MLKDLLLASAVTLALSVAPSVVLAQTATQDMTEPAQSETTEPAETQATEPAQTAPTTDQDDAATAPAGEQTGEDTAAAPATGGDLSYIARQEQDQWMATDFIGQSIANQEGESVGQVVDLVMGPDGKATGVVIGVGGFLGIGQKNVALPIEAVQRIDDGAGNMTLTVVAANTEELENAPAFMTLAAQQAEAERQQATEGQGTLGGGTATPPATTE